MNNAKLLVNTPDLDGWSLEAIDKLKGLMGEDRASKLISGAIKEIFKCLARDNGITVDMPYEMASGPSDKDGFGRKLPKDPLTIDLRLRLQEDFDSGSWIALRFSMRDAIDMARLREDGSTDDYYGIEKIRDGLRKFADDLDVLAKAIKARNAGLEP